MDSVQKKTNAFDRRVDVCVSEHFHPQLLRPDFPFHVAFSRVQQIRRKMIEKRKIENRTSTMFLVSSTWSSCSSILPRSHFCSGRTKCVEISIVKANTSMKVKK